MPAVRGRKGAFDKRFRQYTKRVAARYDRTMTAVQNEIADATLKILDDTAPWTSGNLRGTGPHPGATISKRYPNLNSGFTKFRREIGGKGTVVISNPVWDLYGRRLEEGELVHNPTLGGRPWEPGFVQRALDIVKLTFDPRRIKRAGP